MKCFPLGKVLVASFMCLLCGQCKSRHQVLKVDEQKILYTKAVELFESEFTIIHNENGKYALVTKAVRSQADQIYPTLYFFVWSNNDHRLVYRDTLPQGKVHWSGIYEITCHSIPGRVNDSHGGKKYILDVRTGKPDKISR